MNTTGNPVFDYAVVVSLGLIALRGGGQAIRVTLVWLWAKIRGADTEWTGIRQAPKEINRVERKVDALAVDVLDIKKLLNGGGLGAAMVDLKGVVTDHIAGAETTREQLVDEQRELRRDLTDAVAALTAGQTRVEDELGQRIDQLKETVDRRLFVLEERDRAQTAVLHEVGFDTELPPPA